jgi:hypothetical protein
MISATGLVTASSIAAGTDFNAGGFTMASGETEVGYESVIVPGKPEDQHCPVADGKRPG